VDSDGLVTGEGAGTATITADFTGISGPETLTIVITVEGDGEVLNGLIVFTSERDNGNAEVYVMDADGGNQTNLTNDNFASDREPTWSPFGTQIAFVSDRTESDRIHTMNADGFNVSFALGASGASWPAWSPDGQQIAYLVDGAVHVMDSDGDNDVELPTSLSFAEAGLDWSPDGTQIVASDNGSIVIFNSDGTGSPSEVTSGSFDIYPAWSPDGDQIAFMRSDGEGPGDLYVYTFSLESESNLTTGSGSSDDGQPAWSPGGLKIVFWSNRTEDDRIWVMDADGSAQSQITTGGQDVDPEPQPPVSIID
jgi:Tol biopolymer transport system component